MDARNGVGGGRGMHRNGCEEWHRGTTIEWRRVLSKDNSHTECRSGWMGGSPWGLGDGALVEGRRPLVPDGLEDHVEGPAVLHLDAE